MVVLVKVQNNGIYRTFFMRYHTLDPIPKVDEICTRYKDCLLLRVTVGSAAWVIKSPVIIDIHSKKV
jgi:hypothetical protein